MAPRDTIGTYCLSQEPFMFAIPEPEFKPRPPEEILAEAARSPNAFNYWYGAVEANGILSPATLSFDLNPGLQVEMINGQPLSEPSLKCLDALVEKVQEMGEKHGFPLFIKTAFTSAKHYWSEACCLPNADRDTVFNHMSELLYFQVMCVGQSLSPSLVIRQMIETDPVFHAFGEMPVTEEYRVFTKAGKIEGFQPYWPEDSIQKPSCEDWQEKLKTIKQPSQADIAYMTEAANKLAQTLKHQDWSVDFLKGKDGKLWLIDMAIAGESYRNEAEFQTVRSKSKDLDDDGPAL